MNKFRLVKVTVDGCTHYEIQEKGWFGWSKYSTCESYKEAVAWLRELNYIPTITKEVINIEE